MNKDTLLFWIHIFRWWPLKNNNTVVIYQNWLLAKSVNQYLNSGLFIFITVIRILAILRFIGETRRVARSPRAWGLRPRAGRWAGVHQDRPRPLPCRHLRPPLWLPTGPTQALKPQRTSLPHPTSMTDGGGGLAPATGPPSPSLLGPLSRQDAAPLGGGGSGGSGSTAAAQTPGGGSH